MAGEMTDRLKAAFAAVSDLSKQLLTVTAGVLTITITFSKDFFDRLPNGDHGLLITSWAVLASSLVFGIWGLMALAGSLGSSDVVDANLDVYAKNIALPVGVHVVTFVTGLVFLVVSGSIAIGHNPPPAPTKSGTAASSLACPWFGSPAAVHPTRVVYAQATPA